MLARLAATLCACLFVGCDGPTTTRPIATPPALPPPDTVLRPFAGSYNLAIDVPDQCDSLLDGMSPRNYSATLESTEYPYLVVRVSGGGYSEPTLTGDLRMDSTGRVSMSWNSFDIGGCDGLPELQRDGSTMMICGSGVGTAEQTRISVNLSGDIWVESGGTRQRACTGIHRFTFTR
jgi:hypothetical protein